MADLVLVDALARLQLAARRLGLTLAVNAPPDLCELISFLGLERKLGLVSPTASADPQGEDVPD